MILNVFNKVVFEISYIGYKFLEVVVGKFKDLCIMMEEDIKMLDEVIVVGYGMIFKCKIIVVIVSVNIEDIIKVLMVNII